MRGLYDLVEGVGWDWPAWASALIPLGGVGVLMVANAVLDIRRRKR